MLKCFVSYAREDKRIKDKLMRALFPLEAVGIIRFWHDQAIPAGSRWRKDIRRELDAAHLALFLVSPDLMASQFILEEELPRARARAERGALVIVPVILRDCLWAAKFCKGAYGFGEYSALPPYGVPPLAEPRPAERDRYMKLVALELEKRAGNITASMGLSHA